MSLWFKDQTGIVNVGLTSFAESAREAGARVTQVEWQPPAEGDRVAGMDLARLVGDPQVEQANEKAYAAYLDAQPVLVGVGVAREVLPGLRGRHLAHAGPPIAWQEMCGPMQGAILGACLFEGWAADLQAAEALVRKGAIELSPCHHHDAVGPMAGIISPSMPVWIVENAASGRRSFSNMNEGLGKVLRFGANSAEVIERLRWMAEVLGPAFGAALKSAGPVELKPLMAQALHMGDEVHNRNAAASGLLIKNLLPALVESGLPGDRVARVVRFVAGNDHTFLNLSMAACKSMLDAAHGVAGSSMVTAMARNGLRFGIRLSGTGEAWFQADAPRVDGLYFSGYGPADAAGDLGDSAITETAGLGGFAMAAAPAIVQFVGGTPADAVAYTQSMRHITLGRNSAFTLPALNFAGTPAGIDARSVLDTGILPVINTGIAHRQAGIGQIGAGVTAAPLGCFTQAIRALAARVERRT
jgi:hypothetical protein